MTPPPTTKKREALFASQPIAAGIGVLANEYAGHVIAALSMPGTQLEAETVRRAKALLDLSEDFARTLRRYLSADETSDAQTFVFTMTAAEFTTVLAGFSATKALALLPNFGEEAAAGTARIAHATNVPAPIDDAEVLDLFAARLIATASRQHAGVK